MTTIKAGYDGMSVLVRLNADRIIALMVVAVALCVAAGMTPR